MAALPVYDKSGKEVGQYEIDSVEIAPKISRQLLHDIVVMYQANKRLGTFRTKSRSEVSGSTKKMYRQKGTGNARAGSRRSGVRRGGGQIFAKRPRDFSYRYPKKAVRAATRMAIASKIKSDQLVILDELSLGEPKTRDMVSILDALGLSGVTTLVATDGYDVNVYKSARNIGGVSVAPVSELNALAVLAPKRLLVTRAALDDIKKRAVGEPAGEAE